MSFKDRVITYCSNIIRWSILSVVFFVPIYFAWFQENFTIFDLNKSAALHLFLGIATIIWLVQVSLSGKVEWQGNRKLCILGISLATLFLISTIFSIHPLISLWGSYERQQGLYNLWHYLVLTFFIIVAIQNKKQLHQILIALLLGSALASIYGLLQLFNLDFIRWGEEVGRLFSSFGQPNFFGHYLAVLLPVTVYAIAYLGKNSYTRIGYCLLGVAEIICLIFTYSRGAWVAFLITCFLFLIWTLLRSGKKLWAGVLVVIVIVTISFLSLPTTRQVITDLSAKEDNRVLQRLLSTFDFSPGSARTRSVYWQAALSNFQESSWPRKLFGVGPDVEPDVFVHYYKTEWAFYEKINSFPDRAHNFIFDILLQFGLLGLIGFSCFSGYIVWCLLQSTWKKKTSQEYWLGMSLLAALFIYAFNNLFSFSLVSMNVVLYALLGLAWLATDQARYSLIPVKLFRPTSRWILTITISLFIISLFYGYSYKPLVADYYYFKVKKAEARYNCREVLDMMEKVLEWYPVSHFYNRIYLSHGTNCFSEVSSESSRKQMENNLLDQARHLSPGEEQFYTLVDLAHMYSILGFYEDKQYLVEAEKYYQKLLEVNPLLTFIYQDYGRMKLTDNKYDEALALFKKGLEVIPPLLITETKENPRKADSIQQTAYFYQLIGSVYYRKINFPEAVSWYKKAIETNSSLVSAYKELADIYFEWNNVDEAIHYNKAGYILDPSNNLWPKSLAILYKEKKDFKTALKFARMALEISPDDANIQSLVKELESKNR